MLTPRVETIESDVAVIDRRPARTAARERSATSPRTTAPATTEAPSGSSTVGWLGPIALAACLTLVLLAGRFAQRGVDAELRPFAYEIAAAHRLHAAPAHATTDFGAVAELLPGLGFDPIAPHSAGRDLVLDGVRSVTIDGLPAIECRMHDADGGVHSLYELRAPEHAHAMGVHSFRVNDTRIRIWREGDLLFGLARDAE